IHERADPYKPVPGKSVTTGKVRYIRSLGFNWDHLANAKAAAAEVASPLDQSVKNKFWNIRVVQHDGVEDKAETAVGHVWRRVQASTFSPTLSPSPIGAWMGPGDGTLPAWSTRLLGHTNLRTLKGDMNHAFAMNSAQTHAAIGQLLGMPPAQMMVRQESEMEKPQIASREELTNLLKKLRRNSDAPRFNFSDLIARFGIERARAFIKRAFVDALKYQGPIVEKPKFADEIQTPEKRKK
ncbi:MAG: hypothetical protein N2444_08360, partial [Methylocystis sp.]|nr:hypothetical protein [Methylocystis sp.]